jgi:hypothetical protein
MECCCESVNYAEKGLRDRKISPSFQKQKEPLKHFPQDTPRHGNTSHLRILTIADFTVRVGE